VAAGRRLPDSGVCELAETTLGEDRLIVRGVRVRPSARRRRRVRGARSAARCGGCGVGSGPSAAAAARCPRRGASAHGDGTDAASSRSWSTSCSAARR
jgi:hypothetical protein